MTDSIVTFDDAIPFMPIEKLVAQIEPQQDLHGYDNPWPAGGGKNLFDQDACTTGKYIAEGGNIADWTTAEYSDYIAVTAGQQYIFSGTNKTEAQSTTRIHGYNSSKAWVQQITTESVVADAKWNTTFTVPEGISFVRVSTGYPLPDGQLEKGSTASAWTPYANECPITGWTGLSGKRDGKNLLDPSTLELGGIDANTGADISVQTRVRTGFIFVQSGTYIVSNESNCTMASFVYDANGNFVSSNTTWQNPKIVTVTKPSKLRFLFRVGASTVMTVADVVNPQVEVGSTASTYEPYTSLPITCTWQTEAGTVYGGTVDVVTGVLTVGWKIVDLATFTWSATSWGGWRTGNISDLKIIPATENANLVAEKYKSVSQGNLQQTPNGIATGITTTPQRLYVNATDSPTGMCVYPLTDEASQTYQLTPQQISTLLGNNTVFVDTGDVSVTYQSTSGSTPVRTSFKSPLKSYSYNALKLFGNTFIEHGKG